MFRIRNILPIAAVLVGAGMLAAPTQARADFEVTISTSTGASATIVDNMAGDTNPLTGTITVTNLTVGDWTVSVQTSVSNAAQNTLPATVTSNLTAFNTKNNVSETITVLSSDTGFTVPPSGTMVNMRSTLADTSPVASPTDTFFSTIGTTNGTTIMTNTSPGSASVTNGETTPATPYTLSNTLTSTVIGAGGQSNVNGEIQAQGTTTISAVPAPPGVVLLLTSLPVLGLGVFLSRRRKAAPAAG